MSEKLFCKICGGDALSDSKFCEYCGTKLDTSISHTNVLQTTDITQSQQSQYDLPQYGRQVQIDNDSIGNTQMSEYNSTEVGQTQKFEEPEKWRTLTEEELETKSEFLSKETILPQKRISRDTTFRCSSCDNQFELKQGMFYPEHCPYCGYVNDEKPDVVRDVAQPQQPQYNTPQHGQQAQYISYQQPPHTPENHPRLPRKSPIISAILSLLIAGLGQIYLGRFWRGAGWFIVGIILGIASGGILAIFVWIGAAVDSYFLAKNYNRKLGYPE
jgi:TM2 domain-containing membrane protein YozV